MKEFQGMSSLEFEGLSEREEQAILDNEARAVELERCGLKRHLRRCNECRYRRGELKPGVDGSGGTLKVPMVKSRHLDFGSTLDRYFPGFSDALGVERPLFNAPVYLIYRGDAHETFWTMRMVRCPACAIWQELRAFRFGGIFPKWQPMVDSTYFEEGFRTWEQSLLTKPLIDGLLCNNCFAKEHGRQELAEILTKWIKRLLTLEHWRLKCQLGNGWGWLESSMQYIPKEYKPEIKAMLQDTWPLIRNDDVELSRADTALLRMRHAQWMELLKRIETEGNRTWISENEWFSYWMHLYDESDAHWDWIRECRQETEQNGDALVEWALSKDRSALL
ncbi:Fc.00g072640.m01.CDS01 [Cosmosporella sp. VM-42]